MRALAIALLLGWAGSAIAETPIPPTPARWVTDTSGVLTPATRAALDARLESYDHATGRQVIVWIGTTLDGAPLEEWCAKAFAAWGVGQRGKDNGVAIFVFTTDRRMRIEVGYGVEELLPDAYAAQIVHDVMAPVLAAGHPDEAIRGAVDQTLSRLGGEPNGVAVTPLQAPRDGPSLFEIILGILGTIAVLGFAITHPRLAMMIFWMFGRGGGGGGFGGGGGGRFSGGGGSSGGGGASGGW